DPTGRILEPQREAAPLRDAPEAARRGAAARRAAEARVELGQKLRVGQCEKRFAALRRRRPYQTVAIAFGQQRHRAFRRKALERHAPMRLARLELADDRDLAVVVAASSATGHELASAVGKRDDPRREL